MFDYHQTTSPDIPCAPFIFTRFRKANHWTQISLVHLPFRTPLTSHAVTPRLLPAQLDERPSLKCLHLLRRAWYLKAKGEVRVTASTSSATQSGKSKKRARDSDIDSVSEPEDVLSRKQTAKKTASITPAPKSGKSKKHAAESDIEIELEDGASTKSKTDSDTEYTSDLEDATNSKTTAKKTTATISAPKSKTRTRDSTTEEANDKCEREIEDDTEEHPWKKRRVQPPRSNRNINSAGKQRLIVKPSDIDDSDNGEEDLEPAPSAMRASQSRPSTQTRHIDDESD
ncbi:hypothetical protein BDZ97DRAFT_2074528 [Flammula alnicola]|nr:hypothetical protein BDZ97DRAFT_2074528 [Flammula alnicola]